MMRVQTKMVAAVLVGVCMVLIGCPPSGDVNIQLIVSSSTVDFGTSSQPITLNVTKNSTTRTMGPAIVTPVESWITVDTCQNVAAGCVSSGPMDAIQVPIRVNHSLMALGQNEGSVVIKSDGAPTEVVTIRAVAAMVADFAVDEYMPAVGRSIRFSDRTQSQLSNEPIIKYLWDFGDGSGVKETTSSTIDHTYTIAGSYTIKYTVQTANRSETVTRTNCIIVGGQTPVANFSMSADSIYAGQSIQFTDLSTGAANPITVWNWVFKRNVDNTTTTSTAQNPSHTFTQSGWYTVSLTVATSTAANAETATKSVQVLVKANEGPTASFTRGEGDVNAVIQFTDTSTPGSSPITNWLWSFGDGAVSTLQNPTHTYAAIGTYTVSLTVTTAQGTSQSSMQIPIAYSTLDARFDADKVRGVAGDTITFTDGSVHGTETITSYAWNFGDGTTGTGATVSHVYNLAGTYTVTLTITSAHDTDTVRKVGYVNIYAATALDTYLRTPLPDPNYAYTLSNVTEVDRYTAYTFEMTSQEWRDTTDLSSSTWTHSLTVIRPKTVTSTRALLFVTNDGEYDNDEYDNSLLDYGVVFATMTNSVVAVISQVPQTSVRFKDDPSGLTQSRSGDSLIACSLLKYLNDTTEDTWPILLPMVKSVVRGMDLIQGYLPTASAPATIKDFVVTGTGDCAWATWLSACSDGRVAAIAPVAGEYVNWAEQMDHHREVYGDYNSVWNYYENLNVLWYLNTTASTAGDSLLGIIDPYSYVDRLDIPKFVFSATRDKYFCPDSAQYYFNSLYGENNLCVLPNQTQDVNLNNMLTYLLPWYQSILPNHNACPQVSWSASNTSITAQTSITPSRVLLWKTESYNRDLTSNVWTSEELLLTSNNTYTADPVSIGGKWIGFFLQFYFANTVDDESYPYVFSTEVRLVAPFDGDYPSAGFSARTPLPTNGHEMLFSDLTRVGTATITSRTWNFGDSTTSTVRDPSHTYAAAGNYTVTLTVTYSIRVTDTLGSYSYTTTGTTTSSKDVDVP